jgi:hypothetical protein
MNKNNRNKLVPVIDSLESRELLATSPIAVPAVASAQIQMASATKLKRFSETIYVDNALIGSSKTVDLKVRDFRGEGQFRRLLVSDLHGKLEKWSTKLGQWQNVRPLTLGQAARLPEAVLYRHTLGLQDKLRWTPGFTVSPFIWGKNDAFRVTGIGRARSPVITPGVPAGVQDLTVKPIGVGKVALEWSPSDGASSYTVKVNGTENLIVKNVTWTVFENLSPATNYTFSVVPINDSGSGPETTIAFGAEKVELDRPDVYRSDLTVGLDGSIWVEIGPESMGYKLNDGQEAGKWGIQQIARVNGQWMPQSPIWLTTGGRMGERKDPKLTNFQPYSLATGLDGSIWIVGNFGTGETTASGLKRGVMQVVKNDDGSWTAQSPINDAHLKAITIGNDGSVWMLSDRDGSDLENFVQRIAKKPDGKYDFDGPAILVDQECNAITTGQDGSIWVASFNFGTVQQIVQDENGKWGVRKFGDRTSISVDDYPVALTVGLDGSIWVACTPGHFSGSDEGKGSVQRIVNENGSWFVKGAAISVDPRPFALKTGKDGSIWVGTNHGGGTIQPIVNERGQWSVKGAPISFDFGRNSWFMAAGLDGSFWMTSQARPPYLTQLLTNPAAPTDLNAVAETASGKATLSWKTPAANGGSPVLSYAVTASQGTTTKTATNWGDTAYTFSGLDFSKGPVYFTVAATNFAGTSPVATLLIGQDGKPIDTTHLTTGITTDGTWVIGDGFDTLGYTYSWEALGRSASVSNGKATFNFGLPNQPQTIVAAGQEIAVTQGAFGSVNLAGAAVYYGAQPNLVFTLNYTDGTTETWTQSISDWAKPQQFNGETTLVTMPYRNRGDGTRDSRSVYLYGYSRAIPQGKTLKSITLPQNQNVRILDIKMGN